ncbi:MAG TPA: hypothetical protein PKA27_02540 [Fimbriimonadaceae bacterium]|nr:hypothetical protein [Fimbriimonadaceae bacterium]
MPQPLDLAVVFGMLLVLGPIVGFAVLKVIGLMIEGDLPPLPGIIAIALLLVMTAISVQTTNLLVGTSFGIALVAMMATFPFAATQLSVAELKLLDIERLEKAHAALAARPDNASAQLELAKCLHKFELPAHAISIAEHALSQLSQAVDDVKNASVRDMFRGEDILVQRWKRELRPEQVRPIACPQCGQINGPDRLACERCSGPYLLERARQTDVRSRFMTGLVLTWAIICAVIVTIAVSSQYLQGSSLLLVIAGCVILAGGALGWLFRPRKIN